MPSQPRTRARGGLLRVVVTMPLVVVLGLFLYLDEIRTGKRSLGGRLKKW